jgi:hypothetical protein
MNRPPVKNANRVPTEKALRQGKILERDGDWISGNHWIQIGLTKSQVRAITRLGKRWTIKKSPCATMARYLISLGLLNLEETHAKLVALTRYIEAEGFLTLGCYCDHVMRAQEPGAAKGQQKSA